jgi:hypothetical protein
MAAIRDFGHRNRLLSASLPRHPVTLTMPAEKLARDCRGNDDEPVKPPCTALASKTIEMTDFVFSAEGPRPPK